MKPETLSSAKAKPMLFQNNKTTVVNDPIHGFVTFPSGLIFELIQHPWFQRLRRVKQMGFAEFVYPGAVHSRFAHSIGAMHLMGQALDNLRLKGIAISEAEKEAAQIAILLHDIGHGPFSHALEETIMEMDHESLGMMLFEQLNGYFDQQLELALAMFRNTYERPFFHHLVSSQLDVDRLDYLQRDSFFSGMVEGAIGASRILNMLNVHEGQLVIEEKGLNSVEHFLNVRRLMYWQVYLHKTNVAAENMLISALRRARFLLAQGELVDAPPTLLLFLQNRLKNEDLQAEKLKYLKAFCRLDDTDIWAALKSWSRSEDSILRYLSRSLLERKLFKVKLQSDPLDEHLLMETANRIDQKFDTGPDDRHFLMMSGQVGNLAYMGDDNAIKVITKKGKLMSLEEATDLPQIKAISSRVTKHFLVRPKEV